MEQNQSRKQIKFHKLKNINSAQLHLDLRACLEDKLEKLDDQVDQYNTKLWEVLDKHAPVIEKKMRDSHHQLWFNDKIKNEIILRRERKNMAEGTIRIYTKCILYPTETCSKHH